MLKALADYGRLLRAGTALARHDVILPGEYHSRLPLPAKLAGSVLRIFGGGARGRPGQRLAKAMPGSRLVVLEDAGHPCYLDQPFAFHRELLQFLGLVFGG